MREFGAISQATHELGIRWYIKLPERQYLWPASTQESANTSCPIQTGSVLSMCID